jgi:ABC-type nitrate/sulfonate/bicarbonate transport system substrate-binding protein
VKQRIANFAAAGAIVLLAAACGSDTTTPPETSAVAETTSAETAVTEPVAVETTVGTTETTAGSTETSASATGDAAARCEANKAVGKLTYASSFDFAAAASIIDVVVAKEKGYFTDLCLDVDLKPGFSTSNYPLVASNQIQFSSAGSYTELVNYSKDGAKFTAFINYGKTPIEALVVKDPAVTSLAALKGKTIGMKGDIPPSIVAMLTAAGLKRGTDYKEVLLDGFDPKVHLSQPIDAVPVYKSNEPGQLDAGGIKYALFDPTTEGIPGSFGILYTSADFAAKNPTVVEDFARAALRGMEDAIADPAAAVALSVKQINSAGNQAFLTAEGETYRWTQELAEVKRGIGTVPLGAIDPAVFEAETSTYEKAAAILTVADPKAYDAAIVPKLYGADGKVIFEKYAG